ncbi:hypothetical protein GQX73_g7669 [Xylaria multiplex]|uniref:Mitochondrial adapter protein MCP1 transmembrane domain-containing protein n=1 Tax=Xylaria multiplex TaxID=323545 RepID=A0A7C8IN91_9PEZI|nr:hypothetical protein GQX73_g7669 [Xylaria multiplex]
MARNSTSLHHHESQETLVSLVELDPSPIDSSDKEFSEWPEDLLESSSSTIRPPSRSTTSSLGLGSSGRGPIFYLTRIQRYSSYTFTFFAGLHFTNTSLIPLVYRSVPYSEPFLLMTRELYQTRLTEPLLVGLPVLAHVVSGLSIRLLRRNQNKKRYHGDASPGFWASKSSLSSSSHSHTSSRIWPVVSNIAASGYVYTVLLASHVAMNRVLPLIVDGDSSNIGLEYVSHGFARHAPSAYIAYILLLSVSAGHMVWGMARWLDLAPPANWKKITFDKPTRSRRRRAWWGVNATAVSLAALWAAGGLGVVARAGPAHGWLATVYNGIYEFAGQ